MKKIKLMLTWMGLVFAASAVAQEAWPNKQVRLIVPFAAGGSTDVVGRLLAQKLAPLWGQSIVVENRVGAGGNIGGDVVAKSPADGYTLLMASGAITINPNINKKMPFDTKKDLVAITNVSQGPMIIVVPDSGPHKTLSDFLAAAKAKPGTLSFGSSGVGSQVHLAGENLAHAGGLDLTHVPYKGESMAFNDLMGGQVNVVVGNFAAASALVGPGRLRALAVTSKQRMPQLPDVPTAHEAGLTNFESSGWFGLFAPANTPAAVLDKIQRDVLKVLADPEVKSKLTSQGMVAVGSSSAEFAKQVDRELESWGKVVAARKIQAN